MMLRSCLKRPSLAKVLFTWIPIQAIVGTLFYIIFKMTNSNTIATRGDSLSETATSISRILSPKPFIPFGLDENEYNVLRNQYLLSGVHSRLERPDLSRRILYEESLFYPAFEFKEPRFICKEDREIFWKLQANVDSLGKAAPETLLGKIYVVENGTFQLPFDCGYRSNVDFVLRRRRVHSSNWFKGLVPLIIPNGNAYQHFQDGTMPKIMQVRQFLRDPDNKILIENPRDKIIYDLLRAFNIKTDQVIFYKSGTVYGADKLIFSCNTPPLHPVLWSESRKAVGSPERRMTSWNDSDVVFITRSGCFNCGRLLLNYNETMVMLRKRYGKHVRVYNGPYPLLETIDIFKNAKIIIGTHGGGLSNVQFCPVNATLIEIMPQYKATGRDFVVTGRMMWIQANMLGLGFWRIAAEPEDDEGNVNVNMTKLSQVLDVIDSEHININ